MRATKDRDTQREKSWTSVVKHILKCEVTDTTTHLCMNSEQMTRLELALQPWQGCVLTIEHYICMFQCRSPEERRLKGERHWKINWQQNV